MHARFFAPELSADSDSVALPAAEAQHLTRVMRLGVGDRISVFDGRGNEFLACVSEVGPEHVRVALGSRIEPARESAVRLTLAQSVLKGEKMDDVIRDSVALGAAAIQPIVSERSEISLAALARGSKRERWRRIAVASAKQCGRAVVPEVQRPCTVDEFLESDRDELRIILVEPGSGTARCGIETLQRRERPASASVLIGPEGGWTPDEIVGAGQHGFLALTLGSRTLRADIAPIAAISALQFIWGDL